MEKDDCDLFITGIGPNKNDSANTLIDKLCGTYESLNLRTEGFYLETWQTEELSLSGNIMEANEGPDLTVIWHVKEPIHSIIWRRWAELKSHLTYHTRDRYLEVFSLYKCKTIKLIN